jgi:hypothetical protein
MSRTRWRGRRRRRGRLTKRQQKHMRWLQQGRSRRLLKK